MSIPIRIRRRVPNLMPISPVVWQLPQTFEFVTLLTPPGELRGEYVFSLCSFPDESSSVYQIWCQSVQPFDSLPGLLNLWYPNPPNAPWGIEGRLVFSLYPFPDESADVNQSWCQSDSFPRLLNCWTPKNPQVPPLCLEGQFVWHISIPIWICTHVCQIWCHLAQKHAKKQHLYSENYNSGPNMQTSTSLIFSTAIFVAFSGALAEELMIFCRHVGA